MQAVWISIALAGIGVGCYLTLRPSSVFRDIPWLPESVTRWADYHGELRNFPAYALLAVPFLFLCPSFRARKIAIASLGVFAASVELVQLFLPGRWCEWQDVALSWAGLLSSWVIFETIRFVAATRASQAARHRR